MHNLKDHGYQQLKQWIPATLVTSINTDIDRNPSRGAGTRSAEQKFTSVKQLISSTHIQKTVASYLGGNPKLVRAIAFEKSEHNNWLVTWHQDKTIAVNKRVELDGWGPWSQKNGIHHVQPPVAVLEQMLTLRIHLDDANQENGCLRVIPKSHQRGIYTQQEIDQIKTQQHAILCEAKAGDCLVMRPHLLHASSKATQPSRRRVLHLEFSVAELPEALTWATT